MIGSSFRVGLRVGDVPAAMRFYGGLGFEEAGEVPNLFTRVRGRSWTSAIRSSPKSDAGIPLGEEVSAAPITLGSGTEFDLLPHSRPRSVP
jgi:hypothetical protein